MYKFLFIVFSELNDELHDTNASHDRYVIKAKTKMDDTISTYENRIAVLREAKVEERIRLEGQLDALQEELDETKRSIFDAKNTHEKNYCSNLFFF